jgi:hypothetical protein
VPSRCGEDGGITAGRAVPVLKAGLDDLDIVVGEVLPGTSCKGGTRLQRGHPKTTPGQRHGGLPRSRADLKHSVPRPQPGDVDEPIKQPLGILRSGVLVEVGGSVESSPEAFAVLNHHPSVPLRSWACRSAGHVP